MEATVVLRQLQAARRSTVVFAAVFKPLTPLQHPGDGSVVLPLAYRMHGVRYVTTFPHVNAPTVGGATASTAAVTRSRAARRGIERAMSWMDLLHSTGNV